MSKNWVINDAYSGTIEDQPPGAGESINQFMTDVILKHPNCNILLPKFSYIYVLVASQGSQQYLESGENSWKEIMKKEQYDILDKNKYLIIAFMMVKKKDKKVH